ncbi:MAG TPA: PEP-CTERM sorting domain-containing protein [Phycisphaerae bacterium]|nr:PEP-CTERM sorting domain-containing protein [Phycisphaerae bacterium]
MTMQHRPRGIVLTVVSSFAVVLSAWSTAKAVDVFHLDFSVEDDFVTPLVNGQDISTPPEFGNILSISSIGNQHRGPAIFDSTPGGPNAGGQDPDLLVSLGNILILQSTTAQTQTIPGIFNTPNDDADGGTFVFDFLSPIRLNSIDVIDIDNPQQGVVLTLTDGALLTRTYTVPSNWTKDIFNVPTADGYETLDLQTLAPQPGEGGGSATAVEQAGFNPDDVRRMTAHYLGSGALDNLKFVPEPSTLLLLGAFVPVVLRRRARS